jgi:hypothetical protein
MTRTLTFALLLAGTLLAKADDLKDRKDKFLHDFAYMLVAKSAAPNGKSTSRKSCRFFLSSKRAMKTFSPEDAIGLSSKNTRWKARKNLQDWTKTRRVLWRSLCMGRTGMSRLDL